MDWYKISADLAQGFRVTVLLILPSAVLGLFMGVLIGTARVYGFSALRMTADCYVTLFRGIPLVVQLFIWYFGMPRLGIFFSPYVASVVGFTMCSSAYHSEYIRGALISIKKGQMLAAQALGFSAIQTLRYIILPQALRRALPGCGNEIIYLIKYSSLAYMITCIELTGKAKAIASHSFRYFEMFLIVGILYLFMVTLASWGLNRVEKILSIPGFDLYRGDR